ncbi:ADP-ribose glycohydrolase oard1 [Homalodisca vitripennis]|nr:ADP-ribose glycohydrolase oard1 [Homalodisca vitripennis]
MKNDPTSSLHFGRRDQHLFYLVTNEKLCQESPYQALWRSLVNLCAHLQHLHVKKLSISKLGCGYDGLDWNIVRSMLEVF